MSDGLDEAAAEVISTINQKTGLHHLLEVLTIREMYARFGGADFYQAAARELNRLIGVAQAIGLTPIVQEHMARLVFVRSALEIELQRTPIPITALDASSMLHDSETGQSYVVGSGYQDGYAVELQEEGENRVVRL